MDRLVHSVASADLAKSLSGIADLLRADQHPPNVATALVNLGVQNVVAILRDEREDARSLLLALQILLDTIRAPTLALARAKYAQADAVSRRQNRVDHDRDDDGDDGDVKSCDGGPSSRL